MTTQTIPIQVPITLYHRLERFAQLTARPVESLVEQALSTTIPPLPDNLSPEIREDLLKLESLDDDTLWKIGQSMLPLDNQNEISQLLEKNRCGTLIQVEQMRLDELQHLADNLMLRKAYAYVLLKWRGHRLPTLAELKNQT